MIKETISSKVSDRKLTGLSGLILRIMGWSLDDNKPKEVNRSVLIMAPHTSNWDFFIGRLAMYCYGFTPRIFVKKEAFFFPIGILLKKVGCVPIHRGKSGGLVQSICNEFEKNDEFTVFITPEGSRSKVDQWKTGFHRIAEKADVPIVVSFMDYKNKRGGFGPVFYPTGNYDADLNAIMDWYKQRSPEGKFHENAFY